MLISAIWRGVNDCNVSAETWSDWLNSEIQLVWFRRRRDTLGRWRVEEEAAADKKRAKEEKCEIFLSIAKSENASCTCTCTQISRNEREMCVVPNVQQLMMSILLIKSQSFGNFHVARVLLLPADRRRWARMCVNRNTTSCSDIKSLFQAQIIKLNILCSVILSHRIIIAFSTSQRSTLNWNPYYSLASSTFCTIALAQKKLRHYTTTKRRNGRMN